MSIFVAIFFTFVSSAQASLFEEKQENREEWEQKQTERKEERQENRQDRQENQQERRDEITQNIADRVEERFSRHEKRLANWIERVKKHISKKEENGKDMADAQKAVVTAQASLDSAVKLGKEAVTLLQAITPEKWSEQKEDAQKAREAVKKAQVAFAQVIKDMKAVLSELKKGDE